MVQHFARLAVILCACGQAYFGLALVAATKSPSAAVFAEPGQAPGTNETAAELLRFVTAYRTGLEALVDITPYTALLNTAADGDGNLNFYTFIDTWVGNSSGRDILYMDNVTGKCAAFRHSDGNGWSVTLDLVFWPRESAAVDTRPKHSVTLASGYFGARFPFGVVSVHEGKLPEGSKDVQLSSAADLSDAAVKPPVYACPTGTDEVMRAALLGYASRQAYVMKKSQASDANKKAAREDFEVMLVQMLAGPYLAQVPVEEVFETNNSVVAAFDPKSMRVIPGMPVYYMDGDVYTPMKLSTMWLNQSYPFKPAGQVVSVGNGKMLVQMQRPCLPTNATRQLPRLMMPAGPSVLSEAAALVEHALSQGESAAGAPAPSPKPGQAAGVEEPQLLVPTAGWDRWRRAVVDKEELLPILLEEESRGKLRDSQQLLGPPPLIGRISEPLADGANSSAFSQVGQEAEVNGTRVCIIQQHRQGNVFKRRFSLPRFGVGDRTLLQIAVTGHGWAATSAQCGEYCHAVYRLVMNGQSMANVTQFRDDCLKNPINGSVQYGTWDESRNGWCPGTVEPGLFIDVTDWALAGTNEIDFNVDVWSNHTGQYEPYTDFSGFPMGDQASLTVGLSLFVYGADAVTAVRAQSRPFTAAEAALRNGSSNPQALKPAPPAPLPGEIPSYLELLATPPLVRPRTIPAFVEISPDDGGAEQAEAEAENVAALEADPPSFLQLGQGTKRIMRREEDGGAEGRRFDFEARAPWYLYNESSEGAPGAVASSARVRVFQGALMQGSSRVVRASVPRGALAADWASAALYLRLSRPPGSLQYDHWDRQASIGLVLKDGQQNAKVHVGAPAVNHLVWRLAAGT